MDALGTMSAAVAIMPASGVLLGRRARVFVVDRKMGLCAVMEGRRVGKDVNVLFGKMVCVEVHDALVRAVRQLEAASVTVRIVAEWMG